MYFLQVVMTVLLQAHTVYDYGESSDKILEPTFPLQKFFHVYVQFNLFIRESNFKVIYWSFLSIMV